MTEDVKAADTKKSIDNNIAALKPKDVVWALYKKEWWPVFVCHTYDKGKKGGQQKSFTYVFFPCDVENLPRERFRCTHKEAYSVRAENDFLPSNATREMVESYLSASAYLKKKNMELGSNLPPRPMEEKMVRISELQKRFGITKLSSNGIVENKEVKAKVEPVKEENSRSNNVGDEGEKEQNGFEKRPTRKVAKRAAKEPLADSPNKICASSQQPSSSVDGPGKPSDEGNNTSNNSEQHRINRNEDGREKDTVNLINKLKNVLFASTQQLLEEVWKEPQVQGYRTPPRRTMLIGMNWTKLFTDREADLLLERTFRFVQWFEPEANILPTLHLANNVILPALLNLALKKVHDITSPDAEEWINMVIVESTYPKPAVASGLNDLIRAVDFLENSSRATT